MHADSIRTVHIRNLPIFLSLIVAISAVAQLGKSLTQQGGEPQWTVTLHQQLNKSCALVQPAALRDDGRYVSLFLPGIAEQIYSPELAKDDFLVYSADLPRTLVGIAGRSGFRLKKSDGNTETSPRIVADSDSSPCPELEEALRTGARERSERRLQIQSRLYHPGLDGVTPPRALSAPNPNPEQPSSTTTTQPKIQTTGMKKQGTTVLAAVVGVDGSVTQVKVLRTFTPEMDEKAAEAVKSWRFEPARKNGLPVPVAINVDINFHLH